MGKVLNCILIFLYLDEIDGKSTVFFRDIQEKRRILETFLQKSVVFFLKKTCVYHKKAVILQRKINRQIYGAIEENGF